MIVICHNPAQIDNMSRASASTIYISNNKKIVFIKNFNYFFFNCKPKIHDICLKYKHKVIKNTALDTTFTVVDKDGNVAFDSEVRQEIIETYKLIEKLSTDEIDKFIKY